MHRFSYSVPTVDYFWSHSWSGNRWAKVWTLLMYHNALPSTLLAGVTALAAGLILPLQVAPRVEAAFLLSMLVGSLTFAVALALWPSRDQVFLDCVCINQEERELKQAGIQSIGAILQRARTLVVLWDATYFTRMWCIFELAVWLKGQERESRQTQLAVLPGLYGVLVVAIYLTVSLFTCLVNVMALALDQPHQSLVPLSSPTPAEFVKTDVGRGLVVFLIFLTTLSRPLLQQMKTFSLQTEQLQSFSIKEAGCSCCSLEHFDPVSGASMLCDRAIIEEVIVSWFGSTDAFDSHVRGHVSRSVTALTLLPYRYMVLIGTPFLWEAVGGFAWFARHEPLWQGAWMLLERAIAVFLDVPAIWVMVFSSYSVFVGDVTRCAAVKASALAAAGCTMKFLLDSLAFYWLGLWLCFLVRGPVCAGILYLAYSRRNHLQLRLRLLRALARLRRGDGPQIPL